MNDTRTLSEAQGSSPSRGILDRIVETKEGEVRALLAREEAVRARLDEAPPVRDFGNALRREGEVAVMAEVKRRSPGAGPIRPDLVPAELGRAYQGAGVAAISVLTDREYFGGSLQDLREVRAGVSLPVFRKDFILDPLQLVEARAAGADGVLLIARILDDDRLRSLHRRGVELGLTPLVEVHDGEELDRALAAGAEVVGINNRNLQTFRTSLDVTLSLLPRIPEAVTVVAESGIRTREEVDLLGSAGVHAILVGESFLRDPDPGRAAGNLAGRTRVARRDEGRR